MVNFPEKSEFSVFGEFVYFSARALLAGPCFSLLFPFVQVGELATSLFQII